MPYMSNLGTAKHSIVLSSPKVKEWKYSSSPIPPTNKLNTCKEIYNDFHQHLNVPSRALRNYFPEKPVNPALIRITACNQTGCECMVCTSNPSLMTGLSCPDIGSYTRTFLDLFFEIFGCARQYEQALFLDIFGCALHSPNKFCSALACTKIALACTKIRLRPEI